MHITLQLLNRNDDEIGRLRLQTVRLAAAGAETTEPDLSGQMSQLEQRLALALAQEGMAPVLDPLGVRIAVSRALLAPAPEGVTIPLQVRPGGGEARDVEPDVTQSTASRGIASPGVASQGAASQAVPSGGEWEALFVLGPDGEAGPAGRSAIPPFGSNGGAARGGGDAEGGAPDQWGDPDGWETLPGEGPTDEAPAEEGGWK